MLPVQSIERFTMHYSLRKNYNWFNGNPFTNIEKRKYTQHYREKSVVAEYD